MLRLCSDEDVKGPILDGLFQRQPDIDLVRVQDVGLRSKSDPEILEWAASEGRILITHDRSTMTDDAYSRVRTGLIMPGVFVVRDWPPFGPTINEILMVHACSTQDEWNDRVIFLPL